MESEVTPGILMDSVAGRPSNAMVSIDDARKVIHSVLKARLYADIPLDELIGERVVERFGDPVTGRPIGIEANYELRHRKRKMTESGIVGVMTALSLQGVATLYYDEILASLQMEQPNCEWRLVAAIVREVDIMLPTQRFNAGGGDRGAPPPARGLGDVTDYDTPISIRLAPTTVVDHTPVFRWNTEYVFADISKAELVDPQMAAGGELPGAMSKYIETRQLRHMSTGARANREKAIRTIKEFIDRKARMLEIESRRGLTDQQLATAAEALRSGMPPASVAKLLGIEVEALAKLVGEITPAAPPARSAPVAKPRTEK